MVLFCVQEVLVDTAESCRTEQDHQTRSSADAGDLVLCWYLRKKQAEMFHCYNYKRPNSLFFFSVYICWSSVRNIISDFQVFIRASRFKLWILRFCDVEPNSQYVLLIGIYSAFIQLIKKQNPSRSIFAAFWFLVVGKQKNKSTNKHRQTVWSSYPGSHPSDQSADRQMERSAEETHFWTGTPCSSSDIHSDTETNTQTYKDRSDWWLFTHSACVVQLYFKL